MIEITEENFVYMIVDFMEEHFERWEVHNHVGVADVAVAAGEVSIWIWPIGMGIIERKITVPISVFSKDEYSSASKQIKEAIAKAFADQPTLIAKFPSCFTRQ